MFLRRLNLFCCCLVPGVRDAKVDAFLARSKFNQAEMAMYRRWFSQMPWVISTKDPIYHPTLSLGRKTNGSNWFWKYVLPVVPLHFGSEPCQPASSNLFFQTSQIKNVLKKPWIKWPNSKKHKLFTPKVTGQSIVLHQPGFPLNSGGSPFLSYLLRWGGVRSPHLWCKAPS